MSVPTNGLRVVFCTRADCAYAGDRATGPVQDHCREAGVRAPLFWCLGDVVGLDRRVVFGLTCSTFRPRRAESLGGPEGATGPRDANGG